MTEDTEAICQHIKDLHEPVWFGHGHLVIAHTLLILDVPRFVVRTLTRDCRA